MTLLNLLEPSQILCKPLGLSYIISLTVGMFNLLALVMTEAYSFYEKNINDPGDDSRGSMMCLLFGFIIIYLGSIILHLGPTLIGGEFNYNEDVGNCMFSYGKVQVIIIGGKLKLCRFAWYSHAITYTILLSELYNAGYLDINNDADIGRHISLYNPFSLSTECK